MPEGVTTKAKEILSLISGDDPEKEIEIFEGWTEEARLGKEMKAILLKSGVTELQLQWKNYKNAKLSFWDRLRLKRIKKKAMRISRRTCLN